MRGSAMKLVPPLASLRRCATCMAVGLVAMLLSLAVAPAPARADAATSIMVNGIEILDAPNHEVECGTGTASYDPDTNTLTLDNATLSAANGANASILSKNGDLTIELVGENSISGGELGIYNSTSGSFTIQGTGSLTISSTNWGIRAISGNITIDGATVGLESLTLYEAIVCNGTADNGGKLSINNNAKVTISEATSQYVSGISAEQGVSITDSTVMVNMSGSTQAMGIYSVYGSIDISNSTVTVLAQEPAIISSSGRIDIYDSTVTSTGGPYGIYAYGEIYISNSTVNSTATLYIGIYSVEDYVRIQDASHVYATGSEDYRDIANKVDIDDSWVQVPNDIGWLTNMADSIVIEGTKGRAGRNVVISGDVELPEGVILTIAENETVTVPEGATFTNNGTIILHGNFVVEGGTVTCGEDSHTGGTATCCEKAVCAICGYEYGNFDATNHAALTHVEAVPATCTSTGTAEHWACEGCEMLFSDADGTAETTTEALAVPALDHDWNDWTVTKAPTCTETGAERRTCKRGDAQEARAIDALGHDLARVEAVAPTCTEAGVAEHWVCSRCGALFADAAGTVPTTVEKLAVEATGHNFKDGTCTVCDAKDPDYTEPEKKPASEKEPETEIPAAGDPASVAPALAGLGTALLGMGAVFGHRSRRAA